MAANMLVLAVTLIVFIGFAHSYLGEKYILVRLLRRPLPKLFGSDDFTRTTLRFAWHITTVAWLGFAALLTQLFLGDVSDSDMLIVIGMTFSTTAIIALVASRGRHLSWLVFGAISIACYVSINAQ